MRFEHLYIHIPFCLSKCRYCDFVSYPVEGLEHELAGYTALLAREAELWREQAQLGPWRTIYMGGGTPSLLPPNDVKALLAGILAGQSGVEVEITLEANPDSVSADKLALWREAGINRLSLGAQSFDDSRLGAMGRPHTAAQIAKAVRLARAAGFDNISIDLIYGLPGQTPPNWREEIERALSLQVEHISLYGLSLSADSPWGRAATAGELPLPEQDEQATMLEAALDTLPAAGFGQYEISNFARAGYQSRHNTAYWQRENYLGLGAAAASCYAERRWFNQRELAAYTTALAEGRLPLTEEESLSIEEVLGEALFLGLRLTSGLDLDEFARRYGTRAERYYKKSLAKLQKAGLLEIADNHLRLTRRGIMLGNEVFMEFA